MHKKVKLSSCPHSSFLISFSGKPSAIYDKNNPDWAPNQNIGYDFRGVSVTSHERYERAQGRSEKRRRSECASALLDLSRHQPSDEIGDVDEDASLIEDSTVKDCLSDGYYWRLYNRLREGKYFTQRKIENELPQ